MLNDQIVRVFISSTFKEFQVERDLLIKRVFPEMRRALRSRGIDLVEIDLRWGITTEQGERGEIIPVCLDAIDRSTYFVGFLGDHYSAPSAEHDASLLERYAWLRLYPRVSVTEIEMLYAALAPPPRMAARALFYIRDSNRSTLAPDAEAMRVALKQRIRASGVPVADNVASPEQLVERIRLDLMAMINRDYPAVQRSDPMAQLEVQQAAFARDRARHHVGAENETNALDAWVVKRSAPPLLVTGAPGAGKSALLAAWSNAKSEQAGLVVFEHYVGSGPQSDRPEDILRRLAHVVRKRGGRALDAPRASYAPHQLASTLFECFAAVGENARSSNTQWLVVLDGLNHLSAGQDLLWLPAELPDGVRLVASSEGDTVEFAGEYLDSILALTRTELAAVGDTDDVTYTDRRSDDRVTDAWRRRNWQEVALAPLSEGERAKLIAASTARFRKSLSSEHSDRISNHDLAKVPLFVVTVLDELRLSAEFSQFDARLDYYLQAQTLPALFDRVLARLESDCTADMVANACRLIWGSRAGIEESELVAMLGVTPLQWNPFMTQTEGLVRSGRRLSFSSGIMREAVERRYLSSDGLKQGVHLALAARFHASADIARAAEEAPWQYRHAGAWDRLEQMLTDADLLPEIFKRGSDEVMENWLPLLQRGRSAEILLTEAWRKRVRDKRIPDYDDLALGADIAEFLRYAAAWGDVSLSFHRKIVGAFERALGRESAEALSARRWAAQVAIARGDVSAGQSQLNAILEVQRKNLGDAHIETAKTMTAFAQTLMMERDYAGAEVWLRSALGHLGAYNPNVEERSTAERALAECAVAEGDLEQAALLRGRALARARTLFGQEHSETLSALEENVASLVDCGELFRASLDARTVLETRERRLGMDHPLTLGAALSLAQVLTRLADRSASELLDHAHRGLVRALGADHPAALNAMKSAIGEVLIHNQPERAVELLSAVHEAQARKLGSEHLDTLATLERLAYALFCQNELKAAARAQQVLREHVGRRLGKSNAWSQSAKRFADLIDRAKRDPQVVRDVTGRALQYGLAIGVVFDIDGLNDMSYGLAAYRLLFDTIEPRLLARTRWRDGDTTATLSGRERRYLISIETAHPEHLPAIARAVEMISHPALLPGARRFASRESMLHEALVIAMRLNERGAPDWSNGAGFPLEAWCAANRARQGAA